MNILKFREVIIDHLLANEEIHRNIHMFFNHMRNLQQSPVNNERNAIKICPRKKVEIKSLTKLQELKCIVGIARISQHFA